MSGAKRFIGVGVLAAACLAASPAYAETKVKPDQAGDAPAAIDVTRARYTHGDGRVRVVARIPGLGGSGEAGLSISRFDIFEAGYVVRLDKRPGLPATVGLYYFNHFELEKRDCDGVTGKWGKSAVRLSVARSCLDGHRTRRVFAQFGIAQGERDDFAPAARRLARD